MMDHAALQSMLANRMQADVACPECGPNRRDPSNRKRRVMRLWQLDHGISYCCARCGVSGFAVANSASTRHLEPAERAAIDRKFAEARRRDEESRRRKQALAAALWRQSIDARHTWAESYLRLRGIELPDEDYVRRRTFRFHPHCPRPDLPAGPAMLVAFEPILTEIPDDPFLDPPVTAIHRIWGRGHRKAMLGPTGGCAVKITPDERVLGSLAICEGVETGLKLFERGTSVWALGSAGAIEAFPVLERVRQLTVFADNDASGRGLEAAKRCAARWAEAGRRVVIFMRCEEGRDYGEA
ncbi:MULTISPECIES: toprim domain-containing protein [unclassified Sinorhizobium]|uniref:toprim domain-containing protein n=1 Tax=unclassified Sinorhizobium TaxID=2613772 RepID=UPI0024C23165|nr:MULTISPECIES: toprim domain-containing protein [unclassified Sinorhizobium]MDK1376146.1 toprim domain-containing protein [Sinorhizobium sp. 6-70]MDK1480317.1 toprim domain-containing protein [Sinorhizobium sp. 6-117]